MGLWTAGCTQSHADGGTALQGQQISKAACYKVLDQVHVKHRSRLLSDNGPSCVSGEFSTYLEEQGMALTSVPFFNYRMFGVELSGPGIN